MKSFKNYAMASLVFFAFGSAYADEWKREILTGSSFTIVVPQGKILETTYPLSHDTVTNFQATLDYGGGITITRTVNDFLGTPANGANSTALGRFVPGLFVGPVTMTLTYPLVNANVNSKIVFQYRLLDNPAQPSAIPSGVSIPATKSTIFLVELETSTDLKTWSKATAGSYVNTESERFFRISAKAN
jgi:hypothetical protein